MSLLTERLPAEVTVSGSVFPIDPDFRLMVELETGMLKEEDSDTLTEILLRFYKGRLPQDRKGAVEQLLWFYRCGEEQKARDGGKPAKRNYDFDQDAEALYTSFLQAYGLDLTTASVHWWQFRRLMFGLPSETPFALRLHYRTADTSGMSKEAKRRYAKLRNLYAIQDPSGRGETLDERNARMLAYVNRRFQETMKKGVKKNESVSI